MKDRKLLIASFEQIYDRCCDIAKEILDQQDQPKAIYGIPRGGLVPAVIISHLTDIPLTQQNKGYIAIIDDVEETGETLDRVLQNNPSAGYYASLYENDGSLWYVFPWEDLGKAQSDLEEYENKRNI